MDDGFVVAGKKTLTLRSPIALLVVCDRQGNNLSIQNEGGVAGISAGEVAGVG